MKKTKTTTKKQKIKKTESRFNVRINPIWREAFGVAAMTRLTDATGLIHQFVKAIVDLQRDKHPMSFVRFGDLNSIPLSDKKADPNQIITTEVSEDIKRIALSLPELAGEMWDEKDILEKFKHLPAEKRQEILQILQSGDSSPDDPNEIPASFDNERLISTAYIPSKKKGGKE